MEEIPQSRVRERSGLRDGKGRLYKKYFYTENKKRGPVILTPAVTPSLPFFDDLIVLEGFNDMKAVSKSINATVLVCQGTKLLNKSLRKNLQTYLKDFDSKIVLLDPDGEGRRMRTKIDEFIGPCLHAFIPQSLAMCPNSTDVVNAKVGVEYASPQAILQALSNPHMSARGRKDITWDDLEDLSLVQACGVRGDNVRARRTFFCNALGIGLCDGSILVKQVNRWGFTWEHIIACAQESERQLTEWLEAKEAAAAAEASKQEYSDSSEDEPI